MPSVRVSGIPQCTALNGVANSFLCLPFPAEMKCTLRAERTARLNAEKLCEQAVRERVAAEKRAEFAEARRAALEDEHRSWTSAAATMLMTGIDPADESLSLLASAFPSSAANTTTPPRIGSGSGGVKAHEPSRVAKGKQKLVTRGGATSIGERTQTSLERAAGE